MPPEQHAPDEQEHEPASGGTTADRPGCRLIIARLTKTIDGIREVLSIATPHLAELQRSVPAEVEPILNAMSPDQRRAFNIFLLGAAAGEGATVTTHPSGAKVTRHKRLEQGDSGHEPAEPAAAEDGAADRAAAGESTNGEAAVETDRWEELRRRAEAGDLSDEELTDILNEAFEGSPLLYLFFRATQTAQVDPDKLELLNSSMLVSAVAAFETLVGGIMGQQLEAFPALLEPEEKEFSLVDLREFETVDDARAALIDRRVDRMMRESIDAWERWFDKRAGIKLRDLMIDPDAFMEVLLRRNIVVHNAGRVSRQYLASVSDRYRRDHSVGEPLTITTEYLEDALDHLYVAGVGLGAMAWSNWFKDERDEAVSAVNQAAYALLEGERYPAAHTLCGLGVSMEGPGWTREALRINGWIARKQSDGPDSIRDEVSDWDVTAHAPEFALARAALLDDADLAFELITPLLEDETITAANLKEWPLFRELRSDPRFKDLLGTADSDSTQDSVTTTERPSDGSPPVEDTPQEKAALAAEDLIPNDEVSPPGEAA